jgi:hypothetical protein
MDVFDTPELRTGLQAGLVAAVALLLAAVVLRRVRRGSRLPVGGVAFAVAGLWSIAREGSVPRVVVVSVIGLAIAAALTYLPAMPVWYGIALTLPFGWAIAFEGGLVDVTWVRVLVMLTIVAGGPLVAAFDEEWSSDAPALGLLAITVGGMTLAVPDTEEVAALLGVALALAWLGWPLRLVTLGRPGALSAIAVLTWAAASGARGRPAALIGAVACLGLLVAVPAVRAAVLPVRTALARAPRPLIVILLGLAHGVIVGVAARGAGVLESVSGATVVAALAAALALIAGVIFASVGSVPPIETRRAPAR